MLILICGRNRTVVTLHGIVQQKDIDKDFVTRNNSSVPVWMVKLAFQVLLRPIVFLGSRTIVHYDKFRSSLIKEYGAKPSKVSVIPHGVEDLLAPSKAASRKKFGIKKKKVVLFLGYLTGYKGLETLIDGFSGLVKTNPDALLFVGAGQHPKLKDNAAYKQYYSGIQEQAMQKIPSQNLMWHGFVEEPDMPHAYASSDIFVLPYTNVISSSGPGALATAYGVPVIGSKVFDGILPDNNTFDGPSQLAVLLEKKLAGKELSAKNIRERSLWTNVAKETYEAYPL